MQKGFVTFVNQNPLYLELTNILIDSLLAFTDLPIEVNSINFDYKHDSNRIIVKRINLQQENYETVCYAKIQSFLNTDFDYSMGLDADCIALPNITDIFNEKNYKKMGDFVLPPKHESDPKNLDHVCKFFHIQQTQPYVHGNFLYGKNSKPFLQNVYDNCMIAKEFNIYLPNYDESMLNITLWQNYLINHYLPLYDPWYEVYLDFEEKNPGFQSGVFNRKDFLYVHGCKDPQIARNILKDTIEKQKF